MSTNSLIRANQAQLGALDNGCGLVHWNGATIVRHSGPDALDLLHRLTTKELLSVTEGRAQRTVLTSLRGRVVDVFLVAHTSEDQLILISDSGNSERSIAAIDYYTIMEDAELVDMSGSHTRISLVGPQAFETAKSALDLELGPGQVRTAIFEGTQVIVASDTSRGVEWVDLIWEKEPSGVVNPGARLEARLESVGAGSVDPDNFELFRIVHGIPGSDKDFGEHTNPIESGLLDLIDFDKGCYVGQEVIARLDAYDKVKRNLKVLESDEPLEAGAALQTLADSKPAGIITSASPLSTENGRYMALGLVRKASLETGTALDSDGIGVRVQ